MPFVRTEASGRAFLAWAVAELGGGFHPDTPAAEYESADGYVFTPAEAVTFDRHMRVVFWLVPDPYAVTLALVTS